MASGIGEREINGLKDFFSQRHSTSFAAVHEKDINPSTPDGAAELSVACE
jgi:hypothetical protein